ncbi:hypothetical protein Tco_0955542 [Tanacetum coccineum]|uniref:Uncharacterized protein n=1 Tax=Tanacetum coccineum TaxID=301880 RepID=A0ABQ5E7L5_9ASTR
MNQLRQNGVVLLAVGSDQKVSCVCVFFRGFKKNPMRRVLGFLVLGFCVAVVMLLDKGDGVALLVVSNSETRSRGQGIGKHKRNVGNAKREMACVVLVANEKETRKVQYHVMFSSLEEIVGPRVYGLVLVKKRSACIGNMNKKKTCPCCVEKKKETRK